MSSTALPFTLGTKSKPQTPANMLFVSCPFLLLYSPHYPLPLNSMKSHQSSCCSGCQAYSYSEPLIVLIISARNLFSIYLRAPLPHFIHVSAQTALPQESHPWPLFVTVIIISGTTIVPLDQPILTYCYSQLTWYAIFICSFPPGCKLHEDRGFVCPYSLLHQ